MNKILFYVIFSIGVIFACWAPVDAKPFQKPDKNNPNATLSCILFGDFGCNVECVVVHELYLFESTGTCNDHYACLCEVKNRHEIRGMVPKTFNNGNTKFKDTTSEENDSNGSERHFRGYIMNHLDKILDDENPIQKVDFVNNLVKFLNENEFNPGVEKVFHQIRQCPNGALHDILDKFLDERGIEEEIYRDVDDDAAWQILIDINNDVLISEFGIRYENEPDVPVSRFR